ncbi:hypothetical protein BATDEDRAFT_23028 [Batrachochytrium dendrobatidis JAM81]|uniref:Protein Asterix n=2 Tax=Batrachochytrium dendrobatidis TaxID=109871 RepID=F4NWI3_BATDJ|nr:uncharacterized protein BATDEDRAFT_23028 [Batrachochytrium dendrobatidis JAM81]EGF82835.1 hypothetical protein BATDEDRAFT_23028 [Batrachochytrium dendrobatidis JAM81]KAJ8328029.1 hypothetical protein O5D80_003413 [Batrachochytrium dendrobatidis]KAK5667027.1 hypothetical protein QVD99_006243 [Batrachochytrium dendrobatidis]OAJ39539.1 hypothetical protein BDEG_23378 [Batrachochytrium dendrobatidis JEL423]|eukprot:XP_006676687.1 hypothetical protein BATDEDRAFT_23028 [Batrachochytrium dendrobatidis JAM81]
MSRITRTQDPRRPQAVTPFSMPVAVEETSETDYLGFLALALGILGLIMRHKYIVWPALFASLLSIINGKSTEADFRQGASSVTFTFMGLVMMYVQLFTVPVVHKTT